MILQSLLRAAAAAAAAVLWWSVEFAPSSAFTVIMSDSSAPPTLVDAPQTGFSMKDGGGRTDPQEQKAVYEIMRATGNDWATSIPDVCKGRWHGIECMPDRDQTYHVVSLSFGALSDDTAFPTCDPSRSLLSPALASLPHIRSIFFFRCFSGNPQPIPPFLGRLSATLQSLVLRDNGLVGGIPTELGNLTRLRVLDFHSNNLSSSIPSSFSRLVNLRSLDLSRNRLTGAIPNLPTQQLNILDLSNNLLTGPIPGTIGAAGSLLKMDLSRNRLTGSIPDSVSGMHSLMLLDLSYNSLSGPLPECLSLASLQTLVLKCNPMRFAEIPADGFSRLKNLAVLILSDTGLRGPIPESLGRLSGLRVLHLERNRLNGSVPRSFRELENLSELRLNDNQLVGPIPFDRQMVWRMGRKLRLSNNSGLCYDAAAGAGGGGAAASAGPLLLGIDGCGTETMAPAGITTTQHLSFVHLSGSGSASNPTALSSPSCTNPIPLLGMLTMVVVLAFLASPL